MSFGLVGDIPVYQQGGVSGVGGARGPRGSTLLSALTDVAVGGSIPDNNILSYSTASGKWVNYGYALPNMDDTIGSISSSAQTGQCVAWSGSQWVNSYQKVCLSGTISDLAGGETLYLVSPVAGTVTRVDSIINNSISTSDETLTLNINGSPATDGTITIAQSGSSAGDKDSCSPSASNTVSVGDTITVVSSGNSTGSATCSLLVTIN